jgi:nucleotide-binding universal stress UspA family protein
MFRTIVVPLDGSDFAAEALPVAVRLAAAASASAHVIGVAPSDGELSWTFTRVHDAAKRAGVEAAYVDVYVDPDPAKIILEQADADANVVCLASHDRDAPMTALMHSVGSTVIEHARHPLVLVGPNVSTATMASDVVVALDGVDDPEPLLAVAAAWARQLRSRLRVVTVYEPVPEDARRPDHFTRHHGPPSDPDVYLAAMRERVADVGLLGVETAAIADPVSVTAGLESHLGAAPAQLLVLGAGRHGVRPLGGVARHLLSGTPIPMLVVTRTS